MRLLFRLLSFTFFLLLTSSHSIGSTSEKPIAKSIYPAKLRPSPSFIKVLSQVFDEKLSVNKVDGAGVNVLVLENTRPDHPCLNGCTLIKHTLGDFQLPSEKDHGTIVTGTLHDVAPKAHIILLSSRQLTFPLPAPLSKDVMDPQIINHSMGVVNLKEAEAFRYKMEALLTQSKEKRKPKLWVQSAGNSGRSLSDAYNPLPKTAPDGSYKKGKFDEWSRFADHRALAIYLESPVIAQSIVIVGSIAPNNELSPFSNYPGPNKKIQDHFICANGQNMRVYAQKTHIQAKGTSIAAPIVSGALALLVQFVGEGLTLQEIRHILFESADRNFFITHGPKNITYVYENESNKEPIKNLEKKGYKITYQRFDPSVYGKGILNIRRALLLAKTMMDKKPEDFQKKAQQMENANAKILQKFFRLRNRLRNRLRE